MRAQHQQWFMLVKIATFARVMLAVGAILDYGYGAGGG